MHARREDGAKTSSVTNFYEYQKRDIYDLWGNNSVPVVVKMVLSFVVVSITALPVIFTLVPPLVAYFLYKLTRESRVLRECCERTGAGTVVPF